MSEPKSPIPKTIGLIMDGNRRWARSQGLTTYHGHKAGFEKLKEVMQWAKEAGVENAILYALSTENWKRSEAEISYLLDLFRIFAKEADTYLGNDVAIRFIGERERFPKDLQELMLKIEERTRAYVPHTLVVALSYGGRAEIVATAKALAAAGGEITEETFAKALWTAGTPDPDLILRTGGEQRLSNFLQWQNAYSELFFLETYWPALTREEFDGVLAAYAVRTRNFGT